MDTEKQNPISSPSLPEEVPDTDVRRSLLLILSLVTLGIAIFLGESIDSFLWMDPIYPLATTPLVGILSIVFFIMSARVGKKNNC